MVVIATFGTPLAQETVAEAAEGHDNRPAGEAVAQPFLNLQSAPITMTLNLKGEYKDVFNGTVISSPTDITLAPGEFIVLTK